MKTKTTIFFFKDKRRTREFVKTKITRIREKHHRFGKNIFENVYCMQGEGRIRKEPYTGLYVQAVLSNFIYSDSLYKNRQDILELQY